MSLKEFERFTTDLRADPALADGYRSLSTAAEVAERMRRDGYGVTDDEVAEVARIGAERAGRPAAELEHEQLDQVTGGSLALTFGALAVTLAIVAIPAFAGGAVGIAQKLGARIP
ncbi:hypothetical protein J2847_004256 [Azospirillum agricola]|uniref:Nif11-like leader peptide family natural product precursor n=1 Tax=Azospirillum agricola TaxID=1720247 RepID=UPI001AE7B755|nr:Nif11-like leader peptide family natural product precursor [Azospirillum agricola]MBP2230947.1 hypothetical protein [Azospirillum agricola]